MNGLALYQLSAQYRELERLADDEIPEDVLRDTLEGLQGEIEVKAVNVVMFARNLDLFSQAVDEAAAKMKERAKRMRRRVESLHDYVLVNMQASGLTKIETLEFTVSVVKNPQAVIIDNAEEIPAQFMVTLPPTPPPEPRADKAAIAEAIKAGTVVPGAHLEQGVRLKVKI